MKILCMCLLLASSILSNETFTIDFKLEGLSNSKGAIIVTVYNNEDTFLEEEFVMQKAYKIARNNEVYSLTLLPKGEYAISVHHDENDNGKLDQWFFVGPPKEGVGVSNNGEGFPSYKKAKFQLNKNIADMIIKMNYIGGN